MNVTKIEERYLIVSHSETDQPYRIVGSAYKNVQHEHYKFYLRMLPGLPYFLAPHHDRNWEYLIFSGCEKKANGDFRFFCKIGSAIFLPDKKSIEIHLPDLRQIYYLRLEPEDFHYDVKRTA